MYNFNALISVRSTTVCAAVAAVTAVATVVCDVATVGTGGTAKITGSRIDGVVSMLRLKNIVSVCGVEILVAEGVLVGLNTITAILWLLVEGVTETDAVHRTPWTTVRVRVGLEGILKVADVVDDVLDEFLSGHLTVLGTLRHHGLECIEVEAHLFLIGGHVGVGGEGLCHGSGHCSIINSVHFSVH